jgi:hypothetical protein
MNPTERFTKSYDELVALGLPKTLVLLYGKLVYHAGKDGKCYPTHSTLAKEIGLRSRKHGRRQVLRLLEQLRHLRLVTWERGRYSNHFVVLQPDVTFLSRQMGHGCHASDVTRMSHRKESSSKRSVEKKLGAAARKPAAPPHEPPETQNTKTQDTKNSDDDEPKATTAPQEAIASVEEFRRHLRQHHGPLFDVEGCLVSVQRQLEKRGLAMSAFLSYYAECTTSPSKIVKVRAYCTQLIKDMVAEAAANVRAFSDEALRRAAAAAPPEPPRNDKDRCAPCNGQGKLADGTYCSCHLGRDLEAMARRDKAQPPKKGPATQPKPRKVLSFPKKGA